MYAIILKKRHPFYNLAQLVCYFHWLGWLFFCYLHDLLFDSSVAEWSPKKKGRLGFLIASLAFWDAVSCSVNPQVVGSSPTRGAKKKTTPIGVVSFCFRCGNLSRNAVCFLVFIEIFEEYVIIIL
jgi:hypothetical protein